jgi:exodeoxyribonuclease VII large subunit
VNEPALVNSPELSVSELSAALKRTLEDAYGFVRVRGELGKVSYHGNGHVYFDLKDDRACIAGVIWRSAAGRIRVKLETGLEVVATGRITTYPGRSQYQLVVESIAPAGVGALMALLEERKRKLTAEGLFDPARKQLLPFIPSVIGVVTSPTGAVIRDILHRLADRFPRHVLVWPVRVQGDGSAEEVARAIAGFNALPERGPIPRPDLIIVARGGGSIEDLWSFNEENVVRAAAESLIPLISAVGHETDVTLIDFASDRRAPTPTAAAEMAVPVRSELIASVDSLARRSFAAWLQGQQHRRTELRGLSRALPGADRIMGERRQRLDLAAGRLLRGLGRNADLHRSRLTALSSKLEAHAPRRQVGHLKQQVGALGRRLAHVRLRLLSRPEERLKIAGERLDAAWRAQRGGYRAAIDRDCRKIENLGARLHPAFGALLEKRGRSVAHASELLAAYSYQGVLRRGFALVRDAHGRPLRSAAVVAPGARLDIEFLDGRVAATVDGASSGETTPPAAPARSRARRGGGGGTPGQGSLFGA